MVSPDVETDPRLHDTWLTRLSPDEQDALRHRWNEYAEVQASKSRHECRRALVDHAAIILAFGVGDLLHGWSGGLSLFTALCLGAFLGGLIVVLDATRNISLTMGMSVLFFHQWIVRGGMSVREMAFLLPLCLVFWLVGRRREQTY